MHKNAQEVPEVELLDPYKHMFVEHSRDQVLC